MHRDKFPERVPFRLTRMLTKAMEVSGIEGSYRSTCVRTMSVLRDNKDSLVAMLEAFVYDPLISWRLLDQSIDEIANQEKEHLVPQTPEVEPDRKLENSTATVPIALNACSYVPEPIREEHDEEGDEDGADTHDNGSSRDSSSIESQALAVTTEVAAASHAKSLKRYSEMKALAANLSTSSRLASITGGIAA